MWSHWSKNIFIWLEDRGRLDRNTTLWVPYDFLCYTASESSFQPSKGIPQAVEQRSWMNECRGALEQNHPSEQHKQPRCPSGTESHNTTELCSAGWHWRRCVVTSGALHMQGKEPTLLFCWGALGVSCLLKAARLHSSRCVPGTSERIHILPPFHKERGPVWCQMAMCTDTEIMSWQSAGGEGRQITSFSLLSVGIKDSIYYFGSSQHHSCRWSHVSATKK